MRLRTVRLPGVLGVLNVSLSALFNFSPLRRLRSRASQDIIEHDISFNNCFRHSLGLLPQEAIEYVPNADAYRLSRLAAQ